jgi:dipeptidyl aminopeptidase/acylaminoacyl peptidase
LRTLKVPTELIIYAGEGHLFLKPENQSDRMEQMLAWFDKYLKE